MVDPLRKERRLPVALAAVGLLFSVVLEVVHFRAYQDPAASSFCSVDTTLDCTAVALSRFAVFLQVPLPVWGVAGFLALLIAAWRGSIWLLPLSAFAAVASVGLLVVELVLIGAVCMLCEGVHVAAWGLLAFAIVRRKQLERNWLDKSLLQDVFAPAAGLVVASAVFAPRYFSVFTWKGEVPFPHGTTEEGYPWVGSENPELDIHEFTDYSCPHCKVASTRLLKALSEDPKRIRVVRRQNPRMRCTIVGSQQCLKARIAHCAGKQDRFWQADRWLFEYGTERKEVDLDLVASEVRLDAGQLKACVASPEAYATVDAEAKLAKQQRLSQTPTYRVNGERVKRTKMLELLAD